jgi:hypothetical protein
MLLIFTVLDGDEYQLVYGGIKITTKLEQCCDTSSSKPFSSKLASLQH